MLITKVRDGAYYSVKFNYNAQIIKAVRSIPNAYWDWNDKVWYVPANQYKKLEGVYNKFYVKHLASAPIEIGTIEPLPDLTIDLGLLIDPFPYQAHGIAYHMQVERSFIGDEPGLGKTLQAIGTTLGNQILNGDAFPVLIICPNSLKYNWQDEWKKFAGRKAMVLDERYKRTWQHYYYERIVDVFIINFESLRTFFAEFVPKEKGYKSDKIILKEIYKIFRTVILDESHKLRNPAALQTKLCYRITDMARYIYALSGTVVVNETADLIPQLHILRQMKKLCGPYGELFFRERYVNSDKYLKELNYRLHNTCFVHRKKKEVLKDLPDLVWKIIRTDITTSKEYELAQKDLARYLREYKEKTEEEIEKSLRGEIMVAITICRNISARGKLEAAYEQIDEVLSIGAKILVFVHQTAVGNAVKEKYKGRCGAITGAESNDEREANKTAFQNDPNCSVMVVSIDIVEGHNLTAASYMLFIETPWHPAGEDQCTGRTDRIGQVADKINAIKLLGRNTIDERINEIIEEKRKMSTGVLGGVKVSDREFIDNLAESLFSTQYEEVS